MNQNIIKSPKYIGVMQGRLLPKYQGNYQAHPVGNWDKEFYIAKNLSLKCIEFIFDEISFSSNPLLFKEGLNAIRKKVEETNVEIKSICADYFMEYPFFNCIGNELERRKELLIRLVQASIEIKSEVIVIPCVDKSSLKFSSLDVFVNNLKPIANYAAEKGIKLALETDLPPLDFKNLIDRFQPETIFVNYDIGNSASMGYSIQEEFNQYGEFIVDLHIKDRLLSGGPVILGKGNADFKKSIDLIKINNLINIPLIMQAYRDEEGLEIFIKQLEFFLHSWNE